MGLLHRTAQIAEEYLATVRERRVGATLGFEDVLATLDRPLPDEGEDAEDVLEETPEFLQETPEHDRLWFEQRPPRDFDFDG